MRLADRRWIAAYLVLALAFSVASRGDAAGLWSETVLHTFGSSPNQADGAHPFAGVVADGTGNLYGTTEAGGSLGHGTVFMLIKGASGYSEAVLHNFGTSPNASDGANPVAGLAIDTSGNLYGTTKYGGIGSGVVFELSPGKTGWTETVLHVFGGAGDGANPVAGLVADGSGNLYGTTQSGGTGYGVAFMLLRASGWSEGILHRFGTVAGGSDGESPAAGLAIDPRGNVYGTTTVGGVGYGVVFELSPGVAGWTEAVLHTFSGQADGANPEGGVVFDSGGNIYGTTFNGGSGYGTVFLLASGTWKLTVLKDSASPAAGMVEAGAPSTAELFGTTEGGGRGYGTTFAIAACGTEGWVLSTLYDFASLPGAADGANPISGLIYNSAGVVFGTTQGGGIGYGVVFMLTQPVSPTLRGLAPNFKVRGLAPDVKGRGLCN